MVLKIHLNFTFATFIIVCTESFKFGKINAAARLTFKLKSIIVYINLDNAFTPFFYNRKLGGFKACQ